MSAVHVHLFAINVNKFLKFLKINLAIRYTDESGQQDLVVVHLPLIKPYLDDYDVDDSLQLCRESAAGKVYKYSVNSFAHILPWVGIRAIG